MVNLAFNPKFKTIFLKIKNDMLKERIKKQIKKIKINPEVGKPIKYVRKGSQELYIKPFRLSYEYLPDKDMVYILDLYHKKKQ